MTKGITTSVRLTPETRHELEEASRLLHRGKNWIINEALHAYLIQMNPPLLVKEARQQSLLASQSDDEEASLWEDNSDTRGWSA